MTSDERFFPLPDAAADDGSDINRGDEYYRERIKELVQKCWDEHEKDAMPSVRTTVGKRKSIIKETMVSEN